jgi:hypothetical protein
MLEIGEGFMSCKRFETAKKALEYALISKGSSQSVKQQKKV